MDQALCTIICSEKNYWKWGPDSYRQIKFDEDGTGEVWFMQDHVYFFCVKLRWKCVPRQSEGPSTIEATSNSPDISAEILQKRPRFSENLCLEIALEKSLPGKMTSESFAKLNESRLSDAACSPKLFTVTVKKGNFKWPRLVGHENEYYRTRHEFLLSFDRSLVPPVEEFNNPNAPIVKRAAWRKTKDYVAGALPESAQQEPAMNEPAALEQ